MGFLKSGLTADILNSALLTACLHGHANIVRILLERGASVESWNEPSTENRFIGGSALMIAAAHHHHRIVTILLEAGAAVNGRRAASCALLLAIRNQNGYYGGVCEGVPAGSNEDVITTVAVLLNWDADPNSRDLNEDALSYCVGFSGTPLKVLDVLVQHGANVHDRRVLREACGRYTTVKYLEWLEKQGVSFSAIDDDSEPPFIAAVRSGKAGKVKFFLDRNAADLEWTDNSGRNVLGMLAGGCVHLYLETVDVIECILDSPQGKALHKTHKRKAIDISVNMFRIRNHTNSPQAMRILDLLRSTITEADMVRN
jgi:ankyrin repeat protein